MSVAILLFNVEVVMVTVDLQDLVRNLTVSGHVVTRTDLRQTRLAVQVLERMFDDKATELVTANSMAPAVMAYCSDG